MGRIELRGQWINSQHGIIKLLEIILGALLIYSFGWYCPNNDCRHFNTWWDGPYWYKGLISTTLFVTFIINIVQYILHLFNVMNVIDAINWWTIERIYALLATILLLVGMILETIALIQQQAWPWPVALIISEVLGWIMVLLFGTEAQRLQSGNVYGYSSVNLR